MADPSRWGLGLEDCGVREVIEAKIKGEQIVTPGMPKRPRVANIMKALEASLKDRSRQLAKASGRRQGGAAKRARRKAA